MTGSDAIRNPQTAMRVALTTGEPAGIGPEIAVAALDALPAGVQCVLIGDRSLLARSPLPDGVSIEHVALGAPVEPGRLDVRNARYVLAMLDRAIDIFHELNPSFVLTHALEDPYNVDHPEATRFAQEARIIAQAAGHKPDPERA